MNRTLSAWLRMLAGIVILTTTAPLRANSAGLAAIPSLSVAESWDSNIFNSTTNPQSDYIFRALPALTLSLSALETSLNLTSELLFNYYADHPELNNTSQALSKSFNLSLGKSLGNSVPLQVTPTFFITPAVFFVTSYDYAYRNQNIKNSQPGSLSSNSQPGLPPSDTYVTNEGGASTSTGGSITLDYYVTPRLSTSITGAAARQLFSIPSPTLVESTIYSVGAGVGYKVTPLFSSGAFFTGTLNRFDDGNESKTYTAGLRGSYTLAENYSASIGVGVTKYQNFCDNCISDNQGWSPYINGSLYYVWKNFTASLTASYQIAGGGSFGTTTRRGDITLDLSEQFAEHWSWYLSGYYQRNWDTTNTNTTSTYSNASGTAGIRYFPTYWASMQLSGSNLRQWSPANAGNDLRRHEVTLGVSIGNVYKIAGNPAEVPDLYLRF